MLKTYIILAIAIFAETIATTSMKATDGFTKLVPSLVVIIGYGVSFYGLSQVVKTMNISIAYAIWCGFGIFLVSLISVFFYHQKLDLAAIIGLIFITIGVIIIQSFSKSIVS